MFPAMVTGPVVPPDVTGIHIAGRPRSARNSSLRSESPFWTRPRVTLMYSAIVGRARRASAAAGHRLGHLDRVDHGVDVVRDHDQRLHRLPEHDRHLVPVRHLGRDVRGQEHRHPEVHVGERVHHGQAVAGVREDGLAPLAGAVVDDVHAVRAGPEVGVVPLERQPR